MRHLYSAKGTKGNGDISSKARLKCATYPEIELRHLPVISIVPAISIYGYVGGKARLKCATYLRLTDLSVMDVRVGVANFSSSMDID